MLLDAKINIGRVSRYSYEFERAQEIFLSLVLALEKYLDDDIKELLYSCDNLKELLQNALPDKEVEEFSQNVEREDVYLYSFEYLLQALVHIGIIYRKKSEYEKALSIFELINNIDRSGQENIDAINNLGVCHRKIGDLKGKSTEEGRNEYKKAQETFERLDAKGNKFASINLYKCKLGLNYTKEDCKNIIDELKNKEGLDNSFHLQFLLGRFYKKVGNYDEAMEYFESIYKHRKYIARGSIGFKAYYNLAQCKIKKNEIYRARKILCEIREFLKKNSGYIDKFCEIDYGYCLIQEGKYSKALEVYKSLLADVEDKFGREQFLKIYSNIAECYIYMKNWLGANEFLDKVLEIDSTNVKALYFKAVTLLNNLLYTEKADYSDVYMMFDNLIGKQTDEIGINSGWLISAVLLYKQTLSETVKRKIIKRIRYTLQPISMKSFSFLSDFILNELELNVDDKNSTFDTLYRDFCHIKLIDGGENKAFQRLMNSTEFHYFEKKDRAFLLANIVKMYKYVLEIKDSCRFTLDNFDELPYHYTKLNTLNYLLIKKEEQNPRLRLWNTTYMNDAYEGRVFDKLLKKSDKKDIDIIENYFGDSEGIQMKTISNVYITSFSTAKNSFQMWSIYGDNENGVAIKFDENFFDIRDRYNNLILDDDVDDKYALYKVQYLDINEIEDGDEIISRINKIGLHMNSVEERLRKLERKKSDGSFKSAEAEIRAFITDRLNEVRFLFKNKSYEYENELRLIRCSHTSCIDDKNFTIPRLFINVDKDINNLEIKLGSKLEKQQIKDLCVWLKSTGKVKKIDMSDLSKSFD